MTFIMHSPFDLLSPSQQVINLLTETDKTLFGSKHTEEKRQEYRKKATELINNHH